ncbi:MAG: putative porin [Planctomycetes bacterium]|nr:putative porin [Planctomycetota bacterium]
MLGQEPGYEPDSVDDRLERLEEILDQEKGLSTETRSAFQALMRALRAERAKAAGIPGTASDPPESHVSKGEVAKAVDEYISARPLSGEEKAWEAVLRRLNLYGDLRLRQESDFARDDEKNRHRQRIRLRLGADYQVTEDTLIGARIRTGNADDPNSPHVTLGSDVFDSFEIALDRAFLTYRPEWGKGAWLTLGKFNHPFFRNPVYGELVWDADVQPEGLALGTAFAGPGPIEKLNFIIGGYTLLEQGNADDAYIGVCQLSAGLRIGDKSRASLAAGYYWYSDATPDGSLAILGDNSGNATLDSDGNGKADEFVSHFGIVNPILALTYDGLPLPLTVSAEYVWNTRARGTKDQGWSIGASFGKSAKQGDWRVDYQWQVVEQDAVFSAFSQDDFLWQTNHRSHVFGVNYQALDSLGIHLWALVSERDRTFPGETTDSDRDQWRIRLDIDIKF